MDHKNAAATTVRTQKVKAARWRRNIFEAFAYARDTGLELNYCLTVHWSLASGPGGGGPRERRARLLELLRHWCEHRGLEWTAITVEERRQPEGKEAHLHAGICLPPRYASALSQYLRALLGPEESVFRLNPGDPKRGGMAGWVRVYMLKGAPGPSAKNDYQALVRCSTSRNIGPKARAENWDEWTLRRKIRAARQMTQRTNT